MMIIRHLKRNVTQHLKRNPARQNSLSIEGYQVTMDLIERVRSGNWDPTNNPKDLEQKNAMAAKGYWMAFQAVKTSIDKVLSGQNAGKVVELDHSAWYRELFSPSVLSGILKPVDLAGYRNGQVYISNSRHVPINCEAVRDTMPLLFEVMENESEAIVRAIQGELCQVFLTQAEPTYKQ